MGWQNSTATRGKRACSLHRRSRQPRAAPEQCSRDSQRERRTERDTHRQRQTDRDGQRHTCELSHKPPRLSFGLADHLALIVHDICVSRDRLQSKKTLSLVRSLSDFQAPFEELDEGSLLGSPPRVCIEVHLPLLSLSATLRLCDMPCAHGLQGK